MPSARTGTSGTSSLDSPVSAALPWKWIIVLLLAGLAVRAGLCALAPRWAYYVDHLDFIGMGQTAQQFGLLKVYSVPAKDNPVIRGAAAQNNGQMGTIERKSSRVANYPPLGISLCWLQSRLLAALDPSMTANTFKARVIMSLASVAADLAMAAGVLLLGLELLRRPRPALIAAGVCWLLPPLMLDTAFWGQTDSWMLAGAVLSMWLMVRGRWGWAGLCLGITALLKPQAVLMGPVVVFAAIALPAPAGQATKGVFLRLGKVLAAGLGTVTILSLPWTLADGLAWLNQAYSENFKILPLTTLKAFNAWYLAALWGDASMSFTVLDSQQAVLGLTRDGWGRLFVLAALGAAAAISWIRYRKQPAVATTVFAGLWLWSVFIWPTRVHERYIVLCMPMVVLAAMAVRRLWPAVIVLALVGAAEQTWPTWMQGTAAGHFNKQYAQNYHKAILQWHARQVENLPANLRPAEPTFQDAVKLCWADYRAQREPLEQWEYLATILSLAAYVWAMAGAAWGRLDPRTNSRAAPMRRLRDGRRRI